MGNWDLTHRPDSRPKGCNGKYGSSGVKLHARRGTKACKLCRASTNHYRRELKRGQPLRRAPLQPCGTHAGYRRHERRGEEKCFKCRAAESAYRMNYRK